jgi:aspartate/methionine/tyrosine aminotransferase
MRFSSRTPADLAPNQLATLLAAHHAAGRVPIDLTMANPTLAALPGIDGWRAAIGDALAEAAWAAYRPDPRGLAEARSAVAGYYAGHGVTVGEDDIILTCSTSDACSQLFKLLCDPGDDVMIPQPSYPLFEHLARLDGVATRPYPEGGVPDPGPRTRAVIAVSPSNPTGHVLDRAGWARLATAGVPLIGDEVFLEYAAPGARIHSVVGTPGCLAFGLGGLSKAAGLPQLKLGWIVVSGPPDEKAEALARLELIADTYLGVATPVQVALPRLLAIGAEIRAAIRTRLEHNRARLIAALASHDLTVRPSGGGWSALVPVPAVLDEDEVAEALLIEDEVQVQPGWFYDLDSCDIVISLLPAPDDFAEGADRVARRLAAMRNEAS